MKLILNFEPLGGEERLISLGVVLFTELVVEFREFVVGLVLHDVWWELGSIVKLWDNEDDIFSNSN